MTTLPWFHKTTIYQIYPRSFQDSNGDGIGDLQGILNRLDYLQELGIETLWLSPFFASPQADLGYDVADYTSVAPEYGTMDEVRQLIEQVHRRGMRIIFDLVLNHTSSEHAWFEESRSSRTNPKADWYIWRDTPNNWLSLTGGSGWHFMESRRQYYWATFLPFQPDLNYRNPQVKEAMLDIVRFWLAQGVDGFRLDIFNFIFKDDQFRDNPFSFKLLPTGQDYSGFFQKSRYTVNRPESFAFAQELRQVCDEFGATLSLGEVSGDRQVIRRYLGEKINDGLTLVFDFGMLNFRFSADYFVHLIRQMEKHYPPPFMPVYTFSNHDRRRSMHRLRGDLRKAKLLHLLQLTVRGVPCLYYGEEIGMTDARFAFRTALDPIPHRYKFLPRFPLDLLGITVNRDDVRTPMQWNATRNAGFSSAAQTWLPVHENYSHINVAAQNGDPYSLLNTIRRLLRIRKRERAFQEGSLKVLEGLPKNVLGYTRNLEGQRFIILLNFGFVKKEFEMEANELIFESGPGNQFDGNRVQLEGYGGVILRKTRHKP